MEFLLLTKTGGILGPFATVLGWIINYIYIFLEKIGISKYRFGNYLIYTIDQPGFITIDTQAAEINKTFGCCQPGNSENTGKIQRQKRRIVYAQNAG